MVSAAWRQSTRAPLVFSEEKLHKVLNVRSQRSRGRGRAQYGKGDLKGSDRSLILFTIKIFNAVHLCSPMLVYESILHGNKRTDICIQVRSAGDKSRDCACRYKKWGPSDPWVHMLLKPISQLHASILCILMKLYCWRYTKMKFLSSKYDLYVRGMCFQISDRFC